MAGKVALGPLGHAFAAPCNEDVLGQRRVGVLDLDECELDATVGEVFDQVCQLALARRLHGQHALLARVCCKGIGERCLDGEDGPDAMGRRRRGGARGSGVDDLLVASGDGGPVLRQVQRRHGGWCGVAEEEGRREEEVVMVVVVDCMVRKVNKVPPPLLLGA